MARVTQAFVLGAGLGTRLRPLTDELPKPLVPIFQKRLITFAFDHLISAGVEKFFVNTHHLPACFDEIFPSGQYRERAIQFSHEPVLLETAGGIANIASWLSDEPFIVYNGDILSDLPLAPLLEAHFNAHNIVTLALRSSGGPQDIALKGGRVIDIHNQLGSSVPGDFVFTGIYVVDPKFVSRLDRGVKRSVIPHFLDLIRDGEKLGGCVIDDGNWWDVGTPKAYVQLHRYLPEMPFPNFDVDDPNWRLAIHASATVSGDVRLAGCSVIGANATVGSDVNLTDTIVWAAAQIASNSALLRCIVRNGKSAAGQHHDTII